ncbi:hypothetical protein TNCT_205291 [Trichonephila clavata]|uniref:Uncharacterized protein n=1 Tax=Trichonephila clavata TaxID=2740835 RepID=A0A8X6L6M9_TRICU|nr:hypothetical protein TNCT_205291 [Trichonephila clavata]
MVISKNKRPLICKKQVCGQLRLVKVVRRYESPKNHLTEARDKFREHNSPEHSFLNEYYLLFGLLRLIAIKVVEHAEGEKKTNSEERSASNELANKVKIYMQCLPLETAENPPKMSFFKKTLLQENGLTLWKIYVMDRSLVIGTFGTFLTYGILLGSLGKNEA